MSQVHGWKKYSAWRKHTLERYQTGRGLVRAGEIFVHVEGLGSMAEAKAEEEETNEQKEKILNGE